MSTSGLMAKIPLGPFRAFTSYASLTMELSKREVQGRYRGASFGMLWSLISPFLMLIIYTIAFGYIMKSRWPNTSGSKADFALVLYVGLIVHGFFSDCMVRSPNLIVQNVNLVKRIVFPLDILPWPIIMSGLFHTLTNTLVFAALFLAFNGYIHITILFLPLIFLPLIILTAGVCWIFAALGVYVRDLGQITGVLSTALLFLSSAIIPIRTMPPKIQTLFKLNPLTFIIDESRMVAIWGKLPNFTGLAIYMGLALVFAYLAYGWFNKVKRGFSDVL